MKKQTYIYFNGEKYSNNLYELWQKEQQRLTKRVRISFEAYTKFHQLGFEKWAKKIKNEPK